MKDLICIRSWPSAILHLDADNFFASVEKALNPCLVNRPVVTGGERGVVVAASPEAKALGIVRGMPTAKVKRYFPKVVICNSHYRNYALFSQRIFAIMRRFTPMVEEYSIDEAFADLKGLKRLHRKNYGQIGLAIQKEVFKELGITVSLGISLTKSLAKLASKKNKPSGLTCLKGKQIRCFLQQTRIDQVWGFGVNTTAFLHKMGLVTAYDFVIRPVAWVRKYLGVAGLKIYHELRGQVMSPVTNKPTKSPLSISKTKTFSPASSEPAKIWAHLIKNLERACYKARFYGLTAKRLKFFLKRDDFTIWSAQVKPSHSTSNPAKWAGLMQAKFACVFTKGNRYRATGVVLLDLVSNTQRQFDLFEDRSLFDKNERLYNHIDRINQKFGRHTLTLADSLNDKSANHAQSAYKNLSKNQAGQGLIIPLLEVRHQK